MVSHEKINWENMKKRLPEIGLWCFIIISIGILITLCFDNGIDFDEAYSYRTAHDNDFIGICRAIIEAHDTDVPFYYQMLWLWTRIVGESWLTYRLFSVAGTAASMILGATVIRRIWGNGTAWLFVIPMAFSPTLLHISVNIRMYSWTIFMMTSCAILIFRLVQDPKRKGWIALFLLTLCSLFSHYFTAFYFLFLYLYLLVGLVRNVREQVWKVFACGGGALAPFVGWVLLSDFMHYTQGGETQFGLGKIDLKDMLQYLFRTDIRYSTMMSGIIWAVAILAVLFLRKRFEKQQRFFVFLCLVIFPIVYLTAGCMASLADHFYTPRHVVHGLGLLWLGIAIVIPRIGREAMCGMLVFLTMMGQMTYKAEWSSSHRDIPYLAATQAYIAENMQPGDIVIYDAEEKFDLLYGCYMPEQIFYHISEVTDVSTLTGKRVWYFLCTDGWFDPQTTAKCEVSSEYMGHYGFQIINNCTDFDLLRLEIREVAE